MIKFQLPDALEMQLTIFNVLGQPVRNLIRQSLPAGVHLVEWDGKNDKGVNLASGIYYYQLQAGNDVQIHKMTLIR